MQWRNRKSPGRKWPAGIPIPCAPIRAAPTGPDWLHEIKHDGYRLILRKDKAGARIITRGGYDWTDRYPLITVASHLIRAKTFTIDGEGVVCGPNGIADFAMLHSRQHDRECFIYAFDLIEIDGKDLRNLPLEERKSRLQALIGHNKHGLIYSDHAELDGNAIPCRMGLEGIVSKRRDRAYVSGPCKHWIKVKNPTAPAMLR